MVDINDHQTYFLFLGSTPAPVIATPPLIGTTPTGKWMEFQKISDPKKFVADFNDPFSLLNYWKGGVTTISKILLQILIVF